MVLRATRGQGEDGSMVCGCMSAIGIFISLIFVGLIMLSPVDLLLYLYLTFYFKFISTNSVKQYYIVSNSIIYSSMSSILHTILETVLVTNKN